MLYLKRKLSLWKQVVASKWPSPVSIATTNLHYSQLPLVSLCVISHGACHKETQWLTSLVLEKMWPVPSKGRVNRKVELKRLKNSTEHSEVSLSAHFVWQAMINACILWEKEKKKPDSYHMPSDFLMWQPICVLIPSFCGSESKTWQFRV